MKSIKDNVKTELVINKSTFINYLFQVTDIDKVNIYLDNVKKEHPDASHYCTAYIIGKNQEIQKVNDDGEPSKTAGYPMIEVLKKHNLTNILAVTVRYFGGIKLGAGGLVRAYSKSVAESILEVTFSSLIPYVIIEASIPFDMIGVAEKYIRDNFTLQDTSYDHKVHYNIKMKKESLESFKSKLTNDTKGTAEIKLFEEIEQYE